jgi:AraC-like DNA-binding protein
MEKEFSGKEISRKVIDAGYKNTYISSNKTEVKQSIKGDLQFFSLPCGFNIHYGEITENTDFHSTSEMNACMSINILFEGEVSFALSGQKFEFKTIDDPLLFVNIINSKDIFTRFFVKNRKSKKLNITVNKEWLIDRCTSQTQREQVKNIFLDTRVVKHWQCPDEILSMARTLFTKSSFHEDEYQWELEHLAFQLFQSIYPLILSGSPKKPSINPNQQYSIQHGSSLYEDKLAEMLYEPIQLDQIALKLGASISTLQRHFKTRHQLTIKEYIRNQKLEQARRALLFENKTIGEVSYNAGYKHTSNFVSAFKKYFSITPAALQKRHKS